MVKVNNAGVATVEKKGVDLFVISGEVDFNTVPVLANESQALFSAGGSAITVDLGAVTRADSAALALLVQWLRNAEQQQQTLTFRNVPKNLMSIAGVSGLDEILLLV